MKVIREHDRLYLNEDHKSSPKEYFHFLVSKARNYYSEDSSLKILDIGCAAGDFLYYLASAYPNSKLTGIDVVDELLEKAREEVPNAEFISADITDSSTLPDSKFDLIFMNGVHQIFDQIRPWLDNVVSLLDDSKTSAAFIFGIFNPEDIDVLVKARPSCGGDSDPWEAGWNCFSKASFTHALDEIGVKSSVFYDWNIGIDLPKRDDDPLRSWSFKYDDGSRGIINGTMVLHNTMVLEISI